MRIIDGDKVRLDDNEIAFVIEGLAAGARENARLAEDARRLGYHAQAVEFDARSRQFGTMVTDARFAGIRRITVRTGS